MADRPVLDGVRKAAIVLAQMDPAHCALVLTQMDDDEIEEITQEISRLRDLQEDETGSVLEELYVELVSQQAVGQGGPAFAREMLLASLGPERTDQMLARLALRSTASPRCSRPTPTSCGPWPRTSTTGSTPSQWSRRRSRRSVV